MVEDGTGVGVVAGELFGCFPLITAIGTFLVVGQDGSGGFELVIDLGDGNDVSMPGQHGRGSANRPGYLEDLGIENDSGIPARGGWPDEVRAHRAVWG